MPVRLVACVVLVWVAAPSLFAEDMREEELEIPLRRLCIDAQGIVLASPIDPMTPTQFRVVSVLRGELREGELIAPQGLDPARVRTFEDAAVSEKKGRPRRITQALLFLERSRAGKGWRLMRQGIRLCSESGQMLAPTASHGTMQVQPSLRWSVVVERVRQDLAALEKLEGYRRIGRPGRRVQAMLSWVKERKAEFTGSAQGTDESPGGWDHLQQDVFDWVFACASPEDAWEAVRLYAELNRGEIPQLRSPVFATKQGQNLLVRLASEDRHLLGDRIRALQLLGTQGTLWPHEQERRLGAKPLTQAEQQSLEERLLPLLQETNESFRVQLVQVLVALHPSQEGKSRKLLALLLQTYQGCPVGPARDELAWALCGLVPAAQWKELTGNEAGYCACLRDFTYQQNRLTFWLTLRTPGVGVYEPPVLVLERLGTLGFVAEAKRIPLQPENLPAGWTSGWEGEDALAVQYDASKLMAGSLYRVRVEGYTGRGKERIKWTSEPRKFQVPGSPPQPGRGSGFFK